MVFLNNERREHLDPAMVEEIPLDHVEIAHLRLKGRRKKSRISPGDVASSGAYATKTAIRGAVGVILTLVFGYILLMLVR